MVIECNLGDVGAAIKELKATSKRLEKNVTKLLKKLLDEGVRIASTEVVFQYRVETGRLRDSMKCILYKEKNKGVIFSDCPYAVFVEFGTGVKGAESPHEKAREIGYKYDINGHGTDGWYYFDEELGHLVHTQGLPHRPFMYNTSKALREKLKKTAEGILGNYD